MSSNSEQKKIEKSSNTFVLRGLRPPKPPGSWWALLPGPGHFWIESA